MYCSVHPIVYIVHVFNCVTMCTMCSCTIFLKVWKVNLCTCVKCNCKIVVVLCEAIHNQQVTIVHCTKVCICAVLFLKVCKVNYIFRFSSVRGGQPWETISLQCELNKTLYDRHNFYPHRYHSSFSLKHFTAYIQKLTFNGNWLWFE